MPIYQRCRRRDLRDDEADAAVATLFQLGVEVAFPPDLTQRAYAFARRHRLPDVYDSHYVVLAGILKTDFWTGDRRLFHAIHATVPWARWLGDFPLAPLAT